MNFYYTYGDFKYGVVHREGDVLVVQLMKTGELEEIEASWLQEKINSGEVDISLQEDQLQVKKKSALSSHLPNSS